MDYRPASAIAIISFSILLLSFNEATLVVLMAILVGSCIDFFILILILQRYLWVMGDHI